MIKPYADYLLKTYVNGLFGEYHCYNKAVAACLSRHKAFLQRRNINATLYNVMCPRLIMRRFENAMGLRLCIKRYEPTGVILGRVKGLLYD